MRCATSSINKTVWWQNSIRHEIVIVCSAAAVKNAEQPAQLDEATIVRICLPNTLVADPAIHIHIESGIRMSCELS